MQPTWLVASVGAAVGLAIMGDSLLYSILPLAAPGLGIALPLVGVLLSANRLIRLLSNTWASKIFERLGPRYPFLGAVGLGLLATLLYGFVTGFALFLAARVLWGIAWSGLRQGGYQAVWTGGTSIKGRLTGLLWGLVRLGSAVSVLIGGYLFDQYGYYAAAGMAIVAAILAVPVALSLRWPRQREGTPAHPTPGVVQQPEQVRGAWRSALALPAQRWLTIAGFFEYMLSGIVVSTTALFVALRLETAEMAGLGLGVATITGLLHGARWLSDLGLGPLVGALSDRVGQDTTALGVTTVLIVMVIGAVTLPPVAAIGCLFAILLCDGALHIVMSAAASGAALVTARPHAFIGVFATTTDAGSALGPLVAYSLAGLVGLPVLYLVAGAFLMGAVLQFRRTYR